MAFFFRSLTHIFQHFSIPTQTWEHGEFFFCCRCCWCYMVGSFKLSALVAQPIVSVSLFAVIFSACYIFGVGWKLNSSDTELINDRGIMGHHLPSLPWHSEYIQILSLQLCVTSQSFKPLSQMGYFYPGVGSNFFGWCVKWVTFSCPCHCCCFFLLLFELKVNGDLQARAEEEKWIEAAREIVEYSL